MKVLFIGGTKRGYLALKALLDKKINVVGVISLLQEDHEYERYEDPIRTLARQFQIPCYETKVVKEEDFVPLLTRQVKPDVAFVVGCRHILPKSVYQIPPLGTLAIHDSLLPEYRGFAPVNWVVLNQEDHTGVTVFYVGEGFDEGDILLQKKVLIGPDDTANGVYDRVCQVTVELILDAYSLISKKAVTRASQDHKKATYTCSRNPGDGFIDWEDSTVSIYAQIRALTYPYPGAYTFYEEKKIIIWNGKPLMEPPKYVGRIPGRIVEISQSEGYVDVLTGDGILRVFEIGSEDGSRVPAASIVQSVRKSFGITVNDLMERIRQLEGKLVRLEEASRNELFS